MCFITDNDGSRVIYKDLGIGDHAGKHQGMGMPTFRASEAAYAETKLSANGFNGTVIGAMPGQRGTASAGAFKLMKLDGINGFIIKILRKRLVKFVFNGYHNSV